MKKQEFSSFGFGRRTLYGAVTCDVADNLIPAETLCENAENSQIVSVSDSLIKFEANGEKYIKWFDVTPCAWYFLSFSGKTSYPEWTDLDFGILGEDNLPFENFHTKKEESFFVHKYGLDQMITVRGQDGEWYPRNYLFYVGNTSKVGFFADGTVGSVVFEKLLICRADKAKTLPTRKTTSVFKWAEGFYDCRNEDNYLCDTDIFKSGENYGRFLLTKGNTLKYSYGKRGCYYLLWIPLESGRFYTFSYVKNVTKAGNALFGLISLSDKGKRSWLIKSTVSKVKSNERFSDTIAVKEGDQIAFAVFDGGGEFELSDIRLFNIGKAIPNQDWGKLK